MELIKKAERTVKAGNAFTNYKSLGAKIENIGRFMKWKDVSTGITKGRISVKFDVYKIDLVNKDFNLDEHFFVFSDTLDRVAFSGNVELSEVNNWLKEHGYKTEKNFYVEEQGMSEEDYNEWCNA